MSLFSKLFGAVTLAAGLAAGTSSAATLTASGATGVNVGGAFYDVAFVDGTCISLFDGCDESSDFTFSTAADAVAASNALLALINDPANAAIDSSGASLDGCGNNCTTWTPFYDTISGSSPVIGATFVTNYCDGIFCSTDTTGGPFIGFGTGYNTTGLVGENFAAWTRVNEVPLPASLPLLAIGLVGMAAVRRRQNREA
jgi:hypothetical protein